jgi:hypothetical protein
MRVTNRNADPAGIGVWFAMQPAEIGERRRCQLEWCVLDPTLFQEDPLRIPGESSDFDTGGKNHVQENRDGNGSPAVGYNSSF